MGLPRAHASRTRLINKRKKKPPAPEAAEVQDAVLTVPGYEVLGLLGRGGVGGGVGIVYRAPVAIGKLHGVPYPRVRSQRHSTKMWLDAVREVLVHLAGSGHCD